MHSCAFQGICLTSQSSPWRKEDSSQNVHFDTSLAIPEKLCWSRSTRLHFNVSHVSGEIVKVDLNKPMEARSNRSEVDSICLYLLTHDAGCKDDGTVFPANMETASRAGEPQVPEPVPSFHTSGIVGIPSMPKCAKWWSMVVFVDLLKLSTVGHAEADFCCCQD